MTTEFRMPSLGADMAAGKLVECLKRPGEMVGRGDVVAVVETQKGAIEVEIFTDGVLDHWLVAPGTTVPVGTPLAIIRDAAEVAKEVPASEIASPPRSVEAVLPTSTAAVPRAAGARQLASPAARKLGRERSIDLATLSGTGPQGAIVSVDVERAFSGRRPALDLGAMRQAIAAAMTRSKREIPHYYLSSTMDLGSARTWLDAANSDRTPDQRLLLSALLAKATALAVRRFPDMNGFYLEGDFRPSDAVHLGIAIAIRGGGLVAPAIHQADRLSLDELMASLRELIARARSGTLRSSELSDPTITITSLGERGADAAFPIITPPQVAMVGFGREGLRPWVGADGAVIARPLMTVTLAADHRVSDGHRGGLFLAEIERQMQRPEAL